MGRYQEYETNAERQKAYRQRYKDAGISISLRDKRKQSDRVRQFIAFDGEGYDKPDGTHVLNLFGCNDRYIVDDNGLSTIACFDFMLDSKKLYPKQTFVSFYFSYDVNMILRDVSRHALDRLHKNGITYWFHPMFPTMAYKIEYRPRKMFRIAYGTLIGKKWNALKVCTIYDTFGFFQQSFVKASEKLGVLREGELELLTTMKNERNDFSADRLDEIIAYNKLECEILSRLMTVVKASLVTCELRLRHWHGAGAIAGEIMRKYKVKEYIEKPDEPIYTGVLHSYFGGRIQTPRVGIFDQTIYSHDVVSAYPSIMQDLPTLKGAKWIHDSDVNINDIADTTLCQVDWNFDNVEEQADTVYLHPFPFRESDGSIHFSPSGSGWYWGYEVNSAAKNWRGTIQVKEAYYLLHGSEKPFSFVPILFAQRKKFKAEKNHAELVLKLGLNSLYGKTVQAKFNETDPPYQSYIWGSMITSAIRACLYDMAMRDEQSILMFATDGIYSLSRLTTPDEIGTELGKWECDTYDSAFVIKPGFFSLDKNGLTVHRRTRGVPLRAFDFDVSKRIMEQTGITGSIKCDIRRFRGLGQGDYENKWRKWLDMNIKVNFFPAKGYPTAYPAVTRQYIVHSANVKGFSGIYKKGVFTEEPEELFDDEDFD